MRSVCFFRDDQAETAVVALVNHVGFTGVRVGEYEKAVTDQVHLEYGFLSRHGFQGETLGAYPERFGVFHNVARFGGYERGTHPLC